MEVSREEKRYLFSVARKAIESGFSGKPKYYPEKIPEKFMQKMGVFVTLRENGELRGCIGYPLPLASVAQAVADNAVNAAFHDPRFPQLRKEELNGLEIEITILSVPEEIEYRTPEELLKKIEIGRDGLIAEYQGYGGLLLPQVPVEEKWDKKEYLSYLCMKAGLPSDAWLTRPIRIKAFQGIVLGEDR
ncbi:Uncharacterised protein [uncultured archaeon]|nr:Uncharacterised protein [uncultured archaeon]